MALNASTNRVAYFVDEAGDSILFNRRGENIIGESGCSKFFILGFLQINDLSLLSEELNELRLNFLRDPYFKKVPSFQPENKKTALCFHAKDDLPEVKREVYKVLLKHELKFHAVVRNKAAFMRWVQNTNQNAPGYWYNPNNMYDTLTKILFRNYLHKADAYEIWFSRRGKKDRTASLMHALDEARQNFYKKWSIKGDGSIEIRVSHPNQNAGLQAVDYFLWALQRCYERAEDRYVEYIWSKVKIVHDLDDRIRKNYGEYYNQKNQLSAEKIRQ